MADLDGTGAVTVFVGFGGYWLVLVGMLMAFCMAAPLNLPAFLYGSSKVMAKVYGKGGKFYSRSALEVQEFIRRCAGGTDFSDVRGEHT